MMAKSHAATGALGISFLGLIPGFISNNIVLLIGLIAGAGAALLPDWDHPRSTAATTFGWFSKKFAGWTESIAEWIYAATRSGRDAHRQGGHRTLTHTILFALLLGILVLGAAQQKYLSYFILFCILCLGFRGLFPKITAREGRILLYGAAALIIVAMEMGYLPILTPVVLAVIVFLGATIHSLGDCLTNSGAPLFFPLPIHGRTWYRVRAPITFNTGSVRTEFIIRILCLVLTMAILLVRWKQENGI